MTLHRQCGLKLKPVWTQTTGFSFPFITRGPRNWGGTRDLVLGAGFISLGVAGALIITVVGTVAVIITEPVTHMVCLHPPSELCRI